VCNRIPAHLHDHSPLLLDLFPHGPKGPQRGELALIAAIRMDILTPTSR
jgi:hypothetical protein